MATQPKPIPFGGLSNSLAETIEVPGSAWAAVNCTVDKGIIEGIRRYFKIGERPGAHVDDVAYGLGYAKYSGSERQKIVQTGDRTGGTFTLTFDGETTAGIPQACTATEVYEELTALSNIGPSDIRVEGGTFPGFPIFVDFIRQYAGVDVPLMTSNVGGLTGGTTGAVTITEQIKGGTNEAFYVVIRNNGDTDANLYMVTSNDGFFANTTWTSLATNFNSSDWFFKAYADKMFMANSVDGLRFVYVGAVTQVGTPPEPPTQAPTVSEFKTAFTSTPMIDGSTTWVQSGFNSVPTLAAAPGALYVTTTGVETNRDITLTGTFSSKDLTFRDIGYFSLSTVAGTVNVDLSSFKIKITNADGSPVTIEPDFYSPGFRIDVPTFFLQKHFHFADEDRELRDNTVKIVFTFKLLSATSAAVFNLQANIGDSWPNDTRALVMTDPPFATKEKIEYAYSYWDTSEGAESSLSPFKESPTVTTDDLLGSYTHILAVGSTQLNTSDDRVLFYRREKSSQKWRRLPTIPEPNGMEDFGVVNSTSTYPEIDDHWMEHEIENFPEPSSLSFPPVATGDTADGLDAWAGSLAVISGKQLFLSYIGQPTRFAPSPDDLDAPVPDDEDPLRGVTEYVSSDRTEPIYACLGQEACYVVTNLSSYAKSGETPSSSFGFRRLPGSRGSLGRRSACRFGGGMSTGSQDGLYYYSVGQGFRGEDNGALFEREETEKTRLSYSRLLSDLYELTISGAAGTFTITYGGQTTAPIGLVTGSGNAAHPTRARDVVAALMALSNVNAGDVEVFGSDMSAAGTIFYIRSVGQYKRALGPAMTALGAGGLTATTVLISEGGGSNMVIVEDEQEYWLFNNRNYMFQSRNGRWTEGYLADRVKHAYVSRERGLVWIDSRGRLLKFADGYSTDNGEAVTWEYETPFFVDFGRIRNLEVHSCVKGSPTLRILADDGAGGINVKDVLLASTRVTALNVAMLPGVKHKLLLRGVCGVDSVEKLQLSIDNAGGSWGS